MSETLAEQKEAIKQLELAIPSVQLHILDAVAAAQHELLPAAQEVYQLSPTEQNQEIVKRVEEAIAMLKDVAFSIDNPSQESLYGLVKKIEETLTVFQLV